MSFENVDDRLSRLPEDIVSHILSLMPTKFAVRTSILSKRWRYSWMYITNLDFEAIHPIKTMSVEVYSLTKFVDRVLKFCKTSQVQLFRLHFPAHKVQKSCVSKWIDEAVRLNACVLDIRVNMLSFPSSMFTCKTLTRLRLDRTINNDIDWEFPSSVYLPCLKTLDIAGYRVCLVNVFKLIHGCPVLESLSLLEVVLNKKEEKIEYILNIPTLKRLKLTLRWGYHYNVVTLIVPNLEYLIVGGELTFFKMEDVSSLVDATFSFCKKPYDNMWVQLLEGISGVKSLSVEHTTRFIDDMSHNPFPQPQPIFPNLKVLELKHFRHSILQFLASFPKLEHLYVEKLADHARIKPKQVPACMLKNLTTIKVSICNWHRTRSDKFLEYLLVNAKVLKTVTITLEDSSIEEDNKQLHVRLLKLLPKAPRCCEICFNGLVLPSAI